MGYPAGIGPEVILKALASPKIRGLASFLIIGDVDIFNRVSHLLGKRLTFNIINRERDINFLKKDIIFLDINNVPRKDFKFGRISKIYGKASIDYIDSAVSIIRQGKSDILITAPIHKHAAQLSGFAYSGHTEYLAHLFNQKNFAMMLIGGKLKVALVTTHIPLKDIPKMLKKEDIKNVIVLTNSYLKRYFGIKSPRIAVCGLNPHAGDSGLLGREEIDIIEPALRRLAKMRIKVFGPFAADAIFYDVGKGRYDAVICMYHDQGLVALKMVARDEAVNITLGLPMIRTSPGHGTALDIAGKGKACAESMKQAIITAVAMHGSEQKLSRSRLPAANRKNVGAASRRRT
ncbi:MAG: 4-hydroxythreonine-4-phosphate dehydrogenase PdxA [Candidatus Omnitrophota bacterium]